MGADTGSGWAPVRRFCAQNSWLCALELAGVLLSGLTLKLGLSQFTDHIVFEGIRHVRRDALVK